jgi:quercetin dioxygenase-like cupin family protein
LLLIGGAGRSESRVERAIGRGGQLIYLMYDIRIAQWPLILRRARSGRRPHALHVHTNDYVFVAIGNARVRSERPDGTSTELDLKDGEARFSAPLTHRAVNLGQTPFRNITVEILKSAGAPPEPPPPPMPGRSAVLENDRVRIIRQTLEPGQSTGLHTHTLMSLGVCVSPARVEYSEPGGKSETADLEAGQFSWHPTARTHSLKNVGKTRFEAVEIEWK